jgi:hypothetical protein
MVCRHPLSWGGFVHAEKNAAKGSVIHQRALDSFMLCPVYSAALAWLFLET